LIASPDSAGELFSRIRSIHFDALFRGIELPRSFERLISLCPELMAETPRHVVG
jgi:hypothetical protein